MSGPLPQGWKERVDPATGRPYYTNAKLRRTTWTRPDAPELPKAAGACPRCAAPYTAAWRRSLAMHRVVQGTAPGATAGGHLPACAACSAFRRITDSAAAARCARLLPRCRSARSGQDVERRRRPAGRLGLAGGPVHGPHVLREHVAAAHVVDAPEGARCRCARRGGARGGWGGGGGRRGRVRRLAAELDREDGPEHVAQVLRQHEDAREECVGRRVAAATCV